MERPMYECDRMTAEFRRKFVQGTGAGFGTAALRARLVWEEFAETVVALQEDDPVGAADGMADLLYVTYGAPGAWELRAADSFLEPGAFPPARAFARHFVVGFSAGVGRACVAVADALRGDDGPALVDTAAALAAAVNVAAAACGFPMREIFAEVHRSNMSKTPSSAAPGEKYGPGGGKGPGWSPPDVAGILRRRAAELAR